MDKKQAIMDFSKRLGKPFLDVEKYYRESESVFRGMYEKYKDMFGSLLEKAEAETRSTSFSLQPEKQGDLDYYSPFHEDLYVWGAHRGRMAKRITEKSRIGSEYFYNESGNLLRVKDRTSPGLSYYESFLVYEPEKHNVLTLCFQPDLSKEFILNYISILHYDESYRLVLVEKCHTFYFYYQNRKRFSKLWEGVAPISIEVEMNEYDKSGLLSTVVTAEYNPVRDGFDKMFDFLKGKVVNMMPVFMRTMIRDSDGYLTKYEQDGIEYPILGGKNKRVRDIPQLPNLEAIFK